MAVEFIKRKSILEPGGFQGLSTDIKPLHTNDDRVEPGTTFWDLDTKVAWVYSITNVNPATSNGWWGVNA